MSVSRALTAHPRTSTARDHARSSAWSSRDLPENDLIGLSTLDAVCLKSAIGAKDLTVRRRSYGDHVEITWRLLARVRARDAAIGAPLRDKTVFRNIVLRVLKPADNRMLLLPGGSARRRVARTSPGLRLVKRLYHPMWVMTYRFGQARLAGNMRWRTPTALQEIADPGGTGRGQVSGMAVRWLRPW